MENDHQRDQGVIGVLKHLVPTSVEGQGLETELTDNDQ